MTDKETRSELTRPGFWDLSWPQGGLGTWPRLGRLERLLGGLDEDFRQAALSPAVDIDDEEDRYHLTVELPGVKAADLTVEVSEGTLSIRGEKRDEREEQRGKSRYKERRFGSFQRSFRLPDDANQDAVEASFEHGVLDVSIQKSERSKPKTVAIRS